MWTFLQQDVVNVKCLLGSRISWKRNPSGNIKHKMSQEVSKSQTIGDCESIQGNIYSSFALLLIRKSRTGNSSKKM